MIITHYYRIAKAKFSAIVVISYLQIVNRVLLLLRLRAKSYITKPYPGIL